MMTLKEYLDVEEYARKLEVPVSEIIKLSPTELKDILKNVGEHDFKPDSSFNQKELKRGIGVEMEHTKSIVIAKLIAKDHLSELPDYYSRLENMENSD